MRADNGDEQNNPAIRRRTIYWRTADLSALGGFHDIPVTLFITIIVGYNGDEQNNRDSGTPARGR
jgi:hypothetical protein